MHRSVPAAEHDGPQQRSDRQQEQRERRISAIASAAVCETSHPLSSESSQPCGCLETRDKRTGRSVLCLTPLTAYVHGAEVMCSSVKNNFI